jgi:hypothetical protein
MPIPLNLHLSKISFGIFFPAQDFGDKITLSSRLRDAAMGRLDGESLILPVPANGPPDVPRVQLQSRDGELVLQISTVRLAYEWNARTPGPKSWLHHSPAFFESVGGILRVFAGEYARPNRFVLNPQFLLHLNRSANEYLTREVLRSERVPAIPASTRLALIDQIRIGRMTANFAFNLATARQQNAPERDHALLLQFEMQSAAAAGQSFSSDEIGTAINRTGDLIESRLRSFFPDIFPEDTPED